MDGIDFDKIIMDVAMREHFGYYIPKDKVLLDKKGKAKKKRIDEPEATAPGGVLEKASKKKKTQQHPMAAS
jgi:hypothetical protein